MSADMIPLLTKALGETVYMVVVSMIIATIIGVPLGVLLHTTSKGQILESLAVNRIVGAIVNAVRSIPFIILLVSMFPVTRALVGTTTGVQGVIPPLVLSTTPFVARMVEQSLAEVPRDSIEAAEACGASIPRIVVSALLPEALPSIVRGVSITLIAVLGYTAIAGAVGAGGLGDIAIRYGYYRYQDEVMIATLVLIVILVQVIQSTCDAIAKKIDHR